jgi:hypothetical protein
LLKFDWKKATTPANLGRTLPKLRGSCLEIHPFLPCLKMVLWWVLNWCKGCYWCNFLEKHQVSPLSKNPETTPA